MRQDPRAMYVVWGFCYWRFEYESELDEAGVSCKNKAQKETIISMRYHLLSGRWRDLSDGIVSADKVKKKKETG